MAPPAPPVCGWRPLDRLATALDRVTGAMNAVGTVWILALMLLISADVIGRAAFAHPIAGVPEMVSLAILGIVFLQLANTLGVGRLKRRFRCQLAQIPNRQLRGHQRRAIDLRSKQAAIVVDCQIGDPFSPECVKAGTGRQSRFKPACAVTARPITIDKIKAKVAPTIDRRLLTNPGILPFEFRRHRHVACTGLPDFVTGACRLIAHG